MLSRLMLSGRILAGLALIGALCMAPSARAQEVDRIAAVVNDDIISVQELNTRARVALLFSNIPDSQESRRRVVPQVLRKMIDERLQMQEAGRLKLTLSAAEIDSGIAMIEQQNRMPKGALLSSLARQSIDGDIVREQIKADLTWLRVSGRTLQPQVKVGEEEVSDRLETIKERVGRPEFLASEIVLPVDNPAQEEEVKNLAERLQEQLRNGTPFAALARQFSRSPSAANGGSMGWVAEAALDEEMAAALSKLTKGEVSPAVRGASGFFILAKQDQRIAGQTINAEETIVVLSRMVLPIPPGSPPKETLLARAAELTRPSRSCDEFEALGRRMGVPTMGRQPPRKLAELPVAERRAVASVPVNRIAPPLDQPEGVTVLMVCGREESTSVALPSRDQIRRTIEDERLDMLSRRYLRDLRRAAFIDIRI